MDMSFWNYVLRRRAWYEQERKAKATLTFVGVVSVVVIVATMLLINS